MSPSFTIGWFSNLKLRFPSPRFDIGDAGYSDRVQPEAPPPPPQPAAVRPRNWLAVAALWTMGSTWLGAIAIVFYAEFLDNDPSENLGWTLLGIGTAGFVLTLAAFTAGRTRGEIGLAWAALALALAFTALGGPFLFYGLGAGE
jgi:hypothetical protein